jgi:23S rRNA (uracil1939-C5)-methyltransferase
VIDHLDLTGVTAARGGPLVVVAGRAAVADTARDLCGESAPLPAETRWTRSAASFFQGNRFLTGALLRRVLEAVTGARVADFYAGVGLFAVACASAGATVVAVEGDRASADDLVVNAAPFGDRLRVVRGPVDSAAVGRRGESFDTVIVDPPRSGLSPAGLEAMLELRWPRLVYVSCDPATLARDAAKLAARGCQLSSLEGFDLFPNTGHVETVAVFDRAGR